MFIFQFIIGLQSQSIDFIDFFDREDISSEEPVFIELPRYFNINGGQCDVVIRLKKILYGQAESTRLYYEKLQNSFFRLRFCGNQCGSLHVHV